MANPFVIIEKKKEVRHQRVSMRRYQRRIRKWRRALTNVGRFFFGAPKYIEREKYTSLGKIEWRVRMPIR